MAVIACVQEGAHVEAQPVRQRGEHNAHRHRDTQYASALRRTPDDPHVEHTQAARRVARTAVLCRVCKTDVDATRDYDVVLT